MMAEEVWGFVNERNVLASVKSLEPMRSDLSGVLFMDKDLNRLETDCFRWIVERFPVIVAYQELKPDAPDLCKLMQALRYTTRIAWTTSGYNEWSGSARDAVVCREAGKEFEFEWVPITTIGCLLRCIRDKGLANAFSKSKHFCLCAHTAIAYLYTDPSIPDQQNTSMYRKNLYDVYGLEEEALRKVLSEIQIITGVGFQEGLNAGVRVYARQLGFAGFLCGVPFTLEGSDSVKVRPPALHFPSAAGVYGEQESQVESHSPCSLWTEV